jgi:hypothetical protein
MFSMPYEIASVISLPRNDIMTQSRRRESRNVLMKKLDARFRGHDGENSQTAQLYKSLRQAPFETPAPPIPMGPKFPY